jgi:hypothetical protein
LKQNLAAKLFLPSDQIFQQLISELQEWHPRSRKINDSARVGKGVFRNLQFIRPELPYSWRRASQLRVLTASFDKKGLALG